MKYYDNPYQNEIWDAKKRTEFDNKSICWLAKFVAWGLALGTAYLLFRPE